jgi:hypothetical protein
MFLSTKRVKVVEANQDNIEYYNKVYEEMKSDEAKQAALELEIFIANNQPHILKRIFCCAKPYTGEEEEEDFDLIPSMIYSSGESGDDEHVLSLKFLKSKERDKQKRIRNLWYKLFAKVRAAVHVRDRFAHLTRRIYLFGTSKKLKYFSEGERKVFWYTLLP